MAAPCDPAPQNAIIIVCAIHIETPENTDERIFPGAPCWYRAAPTNRKRDRGELEGDNPTFVTTVYPQGEGAQVPVLAGICIGQPRNRAGTIRVGVAISGAVNILRQKPATDQDPLEDPDPGDEAFFSPTGAFEFGKPRAAPQELARKLNPFLRSMSEGGVLTRKSIATIATLWLPFLGPYGLERQRLENSGIREFATNLAIAFAERSADRHSASDADEVNPENMVVFAVPEAEGETPADQRPNPLPETFEDCMDYLFPMAAYKCKELLYLDEPIDDIEAALRNALGTDLRTYAPETGLRRPWARVLDTGSDRSVRVLLKLV